MASKHFQNKGRCEWWSIHMEGWQRSGLSQRRYCAQHRLTETTFLRWRKALMNEKALQTKAELLREEQRERRRKRHIRLSTDMRSKAVQAYWAMHVEAMTWAGMSAQAYAKAHHLSLHSLKRWRSLFEVGDVEIDWRTHLHPSARPLLGDSLKDITKALPADLRLTSATEEALAANNGGAASSARKKSSRSCWRASSPERRLVEWRGLAASPRECSSAGGRSSALVETKRPNGRRWSWTADHPIGHQDQFCCKDFCRRPAE